MQFKRDDKVRKFGTIKQNFFTGSMWVEYTPLEEALQREEKCAHMLKSVESSFDIEDYIKKIKSRPPIIK